MSLGLSGVVAQDLPIELAASDRPVRTDSANIFPLSMHCVDRHDRSNEMLSKLVPYFREKAGSGGSSRCGHCGQTEYVDQ